MLLDEFITSVTEEKERQNRVKDAERNRHRTKGPLDPLTGYLARFQDEEDLEEKIDTLFKRWARPPAC